MKQSEYIAVFKSLSYAGRVKNEFNALARPEMIKTPKSILGGCSYSLVFSQGQLPRMKKAISRHKKGFIGIYQKNATNKYEEIKYDLP